MDTATINDLRAQGLSASEIDSIAAAEEAQARRMEDARQRRAELNREQAIEEQRWACEAALAASQTPLDSAQARRAIR